MRYFVLLFAIISATSAYPQSQETFLGFRHDPLVQEECIEIDFDGQTIENFCNFTVVIRSVVFEGRGRDPVDLDLQNRAQLASFGVQVSRSVLQDSFSFYGHFGPRNGYTGPSYPIIAPRYRGPFLNRPVEYVERAVGLPQCTRSSCNQFYWN